MKLSAVLVGCHIAVVDIHTVIAIKKALGYVVTVLHSQIKHKVTPVEKRSNHLSLTV